MGIMKTSFGLFIYPFVQASILSSGNGGIIGIVLLPTGSFFPSPTPEFPGTSYFSLCRDFFFRV